MNDSSAMRWRTFGFLVSIIGGIAVLAAGWQLGYHAWLFLNPRAILWDTGIYLTMGRAFLNGLTLYRDIFDLKPPGVFFLSALSLKMFGDARLGNIFGSFALLAFPVAMLMMTRPALCHTGGRTRVIIALLAFLLGAFWASFQAIAGGPWQTEPFGAVFALLYAYVLFHPPKRPTMRVPLAALGLLGSIGMKEPFILSCFAAALLAARKPKDLLMTFVVPLLAGLAIGVVVMALLQILIPYVTYYLPSVLLYRGRDFDPVWMRGLGLRILLINVAKVSLVAPVALLSVAGVGLWFRHRHMRSDQSGRWWTILSSVAAVYIAMLSMGIAGDYQSHHFVFMAPVFFVLCFILIRDAAAALSHRGSGLAMQSTLLALSLTFLIPVHMPDPRYPVDSYEEKIQAAAILDDMLDACGVDRYLSVLGTDLAIGGFTTHSPINHALFWQIDNAIQYGQTFLDRSIERVSAAQVIVVPKDGFRPSNSIGGMMASYITASFTDERPTCVAGMPPLPGHTILFRISEVPFELDIEFIDERN